MHYAMRMSGVKLHAAKLKPSDAIFHERLYRNAETVNTIYMEAIEACILPWVYSVRNLRTMQHASIVQIIQHLAKTNYS